MSDWQNKLDLKDLWKSWDEGDISIKEVAQTVAKRIRAMKCFATQEETLEDIAENFEACDNDVSEFDNILGDLYDWGDILVDGSGKFFQHKKMCWIATRF